MKNKNKRAQLEALIEKLPWIILFIILFIGLGILLRKILAT